MWSWASTSTTTIRDSTSPAMWRMQYPDLKTVQDLAKYPELFPGPGGSLARASSTGASPAGPITEIMEKKVAAYGLDQYYNYFVSGSDAILNTAMTSAWDKQEPIVAYYWEPTWLLGNVRLCAAGGQPLRPGAFTRTASVPARR